MSKKNFQISYSAASNFKTCPTKYYNSRKYKVKQNPSAFAFGKALEDAITLLFLGKSLDEAHAKFESDWKAIFDTDVSYMVSDFDNSIIAEEDLPLIESWVKELELDFMLHWSELFDEIAEKNKREDLRPKDHIFYNRIMWLCCQIRGMYMIRAFYEKLLPKLKIVSKDGVPLIQKDITITNNEGDKITGFVDYVVTHEDYTAPIIIDLKTSGAPYTDHSLISSEQLRTYVASLGQEVGTNRAGYIVLLKKMQVKYRCDQCGAPKEGRSIKCVACGKGKCTLKDFDAGVQFICKEYQTEELEEVLDDYMNIATAIKNNINYKNPSNCNLYNRPCEFYDMCWKRKQASEISHLEEKNSLTTLVESDKVKIGE